MELQNFTRVANKELGLRIEIVVLGAFSRLTTMIIGCAFNLEIARLLLF